MLKTKQVKKDHINYKKHNKMRNKINMKYNGVQFSYTHSKYKNISNNAYRLNIIRQHTARGEQRHTVILDLSVLLKRVDRYLSRYR